MNDKIITKKFKRDDLVNELGNVFNAKFIDYTPISVRELFDEALTTGEVYLQEDTMIDLIDVLLEYELFILVDEVETDGIVFNKYIPTTPLKDNWRVYSQELEKRVLDFIPYKDTVIEFAEVNELDIDEVKKNVNDGMINIESVNSEIKDLISKMGLLVSGNVNLINYWTTNVWKIDNRWFKSFVNWLNE